MSEPVAIIERLFKWWLLRYGFIGLGAGWMAAACGVGLRAADRSSWMFVVMFSGRALHAERDGYIGRLEARPTGRGKSGLHRAGWSVTPTGRKARESATESRPPHGSCASACKRREGYRAVRVKRCGKSAPAAGVTRLARQTPPGARPNRASAHPQGCARAGPARFGARVGCSSRRATGDLEKWPSRGPVLETGTRTKPGL